MRIQLWSDLTQLNKKDTFSLPLMKISAYHKNRGDTVELYSQDKHCDILYCSKIFSTEFTTDVGHHKAESLIKGGTGYDDINKLPFDIEHQMPNYSLYPHLKDTAVGFLTRGCPNRCEFCCVSKKEGRLSKEVAEVSEFWSGQPYITLYDPNFLACTEREKLAKSLSDTKATVKFEQGLDARFISEDSLVLLKQIKIRDFYFAWDLERFSESVKSGLLLFRKHYEKLNYRFCKVYVLVNFNTDWRFDLERVEWLKANRFDPYVMVYDKWTCPTKIVVSGKRIENPSYIPGKEKYLHLQRAVNNKIIFRSIEKLSDYEPLKRWIVGGCTNA